SPLSRLYSTCCPVRAELLIPGALSISKGAVPDRTRGFGHTAPTYVSRFPGSNLPRPGRHLNSGGAHASRAKVEAGFARTRRERDSRQEGRFASETSLLMANPRVEEAKAALRTKARASRAAILNSTRSDAS